MIVGGISGLKRLMARYDMPSPVVVDWDTSAHSKKRIRKRESCTPATLRNVSLAGALLAVRLSEKPEMGDVVALRFRGEEGTVKVCHIEVDVVEDSVNPNVKDASVAWLVGVEFVEIAEIFPDLNDLVGNLREDGHRLQELWEQGR